MTTAREQAEQALADFDRVGLRPECAIEHGVADALRALLAEATLTENDVATLNELVELAEQLLYQVEAEWGHGLSFDELLAEGDLDASLIEKCRTILARFTVQSKSLSNFESTGDPS